MSSIELARFRVYAWLIDLLLIVGLWMVADGLGWLVSAIYWILRDGFFEGQSLGKRILGLKVVVQPQERPCTFRDSCVRNLLWIVPVINVVTALTGLNYLMHDSQGRHWGDRLANTLVVKAS